MRKITDIYDSVKIINVNLSVILLVNLAGYNAITRHTGIR